MLRVFPLPLSNYNAYNQVNIGNNSKELQNLENERIDNFLVTGDKKVTTSTDKLKDDDGVLLADDSVEKDSFKPVLRVAAGELVYDFAWYSRALSSDPVSNCFAVASRSHPVHVYDAGTGDLRSSYRPYTPSDELAPGHSLAFSPDGIKIIIGGKSSLYEFRVERPGRDHNTIETHRKGQDGQSGIISCISFAPEFSSPGLMAAGSYNCTAGLYDMRTHEQLAVLEGHSGGVTHLCFSADGYYLYSGARRDSTVYCWDARNLCGAIYSISRDTCSTNQRMYFDIEPLGRHLATGGEDGKIRYFDLKDGTEVGHFQAASDVVNGCQFHPTEPLLATASGQRRYPLAPESGSDSEESGMASSNSSNSSTMETKQLSSEKKATDNGLFQKSLESCALCMTWSHRLSRTENSAAIWYLDTLENNFDNEIV